MFALTFSILGIQSISMKLGISAVLFFWGKNSWLQFCNDLIIMNIKNHCLRWHLPSFKHCHSEVALDFKNFRIFINNFFFHFFNFQLGFFFLWIGNWGKKILFYLGIWLNIGNRKDQKKVSAEEKVGLSNHDNTRLYNITNHRLAGVFKLL